MADQLIEDEELLRLRSDIDRLQGLVIPLLEKIRSDANGDDMGLMAFCFVNKQMEHIKSICLLADNRQYRDAWLISRLMFEGVALLYWAKQDSSRPHYWRAYWWVAHFRQLYGKPEYLLYKNEIEANLKKYCTPFLKKSSRNKDQSEITPQDYHKLWYIASQGSGKAPEPIQIRDIIESANLKLLHYPVYTLPSGWAHWDSYMLNQALESERGCIDYTNETKWLGIVAYITGYNSLLISAMALDEVFDLHSPDLQAEFQSKFKPEDLERLGTK